MSPKQNIAEMPDNETITSEAASWVAQIDSGDMTSADRKALREWCARSPAHMKALRKYTSFWVELDDILDENFQASQKSRTPVTISTLLNALFAQKPRWTVAASLSFSALLVFSLAIAVFDPTLEKQTTSYEVTQDERRIVTLNDGSTMHLNTGTIAETTVSNKERMVRLIQGEAYFNVVSDEERPFLVKAGLSQVKVVGTAFSVRVDDGDAILHVEEGKVQFLPINLGNIVDNDLDAESSPLIVAGQTATLSAANSEVQVINSVDIERQLSWREGLLVFQGETLDQVIDEVSRYTDVSIVISDASLRNTRIGGTFQTGEIEPLLGALQASFGISVDRVGDGLIYLSSSRSASIESQKN